MDLLNIRTAIKQDPSPKNLKKQAKKVERISANIRNAYEFLDGIVKVSVTRENDKFLEKINETRQKIADLQQEQPLVNPNDPIAPEPLQPVPIPGEDPRRPSSPDADMPPPPPAPAPAPLLLLLLVKCLLWLRHGEN